MMKLGIVAVSNHNYGSLLQTYAMQRAVERYGIESEIIQFKSDPKKQLNRIFNASFLKLKIKSYNKKIICKFRYPQIWEQMNIRHEAFENFKKKYCKFTDIITSLSELESLVKKYSGVLLGSDQVWHPANLGMNFFTLEFVPDEIFKMVYAPSFGVSSIPINQIDATKHYLNRISFLSVRETSGQKIIKEITGKDVPVVCDPTALITREQWDELKGDKPYISERYIFCYFLGSNSIHRDFANKFKKFTGYKIVTLQHLDEFVKKDLYFGDIKPYDVSPADFINLISNAEYVLTDSFHGTMFSIFYHKNFYTFSRFSEKKKDSTNSRISSILSSIGLNDRKLIGNEDVKSISEKDVNWTLVDEKLEKFRVESFEYLKNALKNGKLL